MPDQYASSQKVAVVGAGVVGLCTAYFLASKGHDVTIIEQADAPASSCSFANAGLIAVGHAESWAGPNAPRQMLRALLGREPSVKITKLLDPALWRWGMAFLANCSTRAHRANSDAMFRLALHGKSMLLEIEQNTGLAFDQAHDGAYYLFSDSNQLAAHVRCQSRNDQNLTAYDTDGLTRLDPTLRAFGNELKGGMVSKLDSNGDCWLFSSKLSQWLERQKGIAIHYGCTVTGFTRNAGRVTALQTDKGEIVCNKVVLAAGTGTPILTTPLGARPYIYPVKGYSATYPILDKTRIPARPLIDETRLTAVTQLGDLLRVTAIAEFAGHNRSVDTRRTACLDRYVVSHFSGAVDVSRAIYWVGLRPTTPSGRPYLGRLRCTENVWVNAGHGQLGWTMAAGAGQIIANSMSGLPPSPNDVSETADWLDSV